MTTEDLVSDTLIVPLPAEAPVESERLRAIRRPERDQGGLQALEVLSAPFVSYDVAKADLVLASEGVFQSIVRSAGHATVRVLLAADLDLMARMKLLLGLKELGCTAEDPRGRYYALDAPPDVDLEAVADHLGVAEEAGQLEFEIVTGEA